MLPRLPLAWRKDGGGRELARAQEAIASAFGAALFGVHGGKPAPAR
jgi:hypothetical protein